ncbi:hypothetical protein [Natrinema pallidum]|uniref:hypothetical protein n=1 Tax=Natrinema pallidum TaxID=69527 RepID=UPI00375021A4
MNDETCDRCGFKNDPIADVRFWSGSWDAPADSDQDEYNVICDDCHAELVRN